MPKGFDIGLLLESSWSVSKGLELGRAAEENGYDTVWANGNILGRDPVTLLALMAAQTRRVKLGTNVINAYIRHPVVIASSVASLQDASQGRFVLGFGSAYPDILNKIGLEGERPLTRVREAIQLVRSLLAGESVDFKGREFSLNAAKLGFESRTSVPVFLGLGSGPKMMRLAGELCDGAIISESTDEQYREQIAMIREGRALAKKAPDGFQIVINSMISVDKSRKEAVDALRPSVQARLGRKPAAMGRFGVSESEGKRYVEDPRTIPEDYIQHLTISGTADDCLKRIKEYREMGITGVAHRYPTMDQVKGVHDLLLPALAAVG